MNDTLDPAASHDDALSADPRPTDPSAMTGLKIVVNGRTVVHRHFLQQAMDAMVRRALDEESLAPSST